jgi:hypothetical protein
MPPGWTEGGTSSPVRGSQLIRHGVMDRMTRSLSLAKQSLPFHEDGTAY